MTFRIETMALGGLEVNILDIEERAWENLSYPNYFCMIFSLYGYNPSRAKLQMLSIH